MGDEARRLWRRFWHCRHPQMWRIIEEADPGFWADLHDTLGRVHDALTTREGAVVRPLPATREAGTQVGHGVIRRRTVFTQHGFSYVRPRPSVAVQTERGSRRETAVQTRMEEAPSREVAVQTGREPRSEATTQTAEEAREPPFRPGCWNCGGTHPYTRCPEPRRAVFCYGCGEHGATLRDCRRCSPRYRPYENRRGPRDRSPGRSEDRENNSGGRGAWTEDRWE